MTIVYFPTTVICITLYFRRVNGPEDILADEKVTHNRSKWSKSSFSGGNTKKNLFREHASPNYDNTTTANQHVNHETGIPFSKFLNIIHDVEKSLNE